MIFCRCFAFLILFSPLFAVISPPCVNLPFKVNSNDYFWKIFPCHHDSSRSLMAGYFCDGIRYCPSNEDEACLEWLPAGNLNLIFVRWPEFDCATPFCFNRNRTTDLMAHMTCQELGYATFSSFGWVSRQENDTTPAIPGLKVECWGHEFKVRQCASRSIWDFDTDCQRFFAVSCLRFYEKTLSLPLPGVTRFIRNPGYPNHIYSNMDCSWYFRLENRNRTNAVLVLQFDLINLHVDEFHNHPIRRRRHVTFGKLDNMDEDGEVICLDKPLIRIFIGQWGQGYRLIKVCHQSQAKRILAGGPWVLVQYSSARSLKHEELQKPRGFVLRYWTMKCDIVEKSTCKNVTEVDLPGSTGQPNMRQSPQYAIPLWLVAILTVSILAFIIGLICLHRAVYYKCRVKRFGMYQDAHANMGRLPQGCFHGWLDICLGPQTPRSLRRATNGSKWRFRPVLNASSLDELRKHPKPVRKWWRLFGRRHSNEVQVDPRAFIGGVPLPEATITTPIKWYDHRGRFEVRGNTVYIRAGAEPGLDHYMPCHPPDMKWELGGIMWPSPDKIKVRKVGKLPPVPKMKIPKIQRKDSGEYSYIPSPETSCSIGLSTICRFNQEPQELSASETSALFNNNCPSVSDISMEDEDHYTQIISQEKFISLCKRTKL